MPTIHPFHGWRYNQDIVGDISKVIAPPYDVISPEEQEVLYQLSPHNFVRLILNSGIGEERYQESARVLREWIQQEALRRDEPEIIYLMDQTFTLNGEKVTRTGIIAALDLEEMGKNILPHEQTIAKHIEDRYRLMDATKTNLGQIFMSYRDESMTVESLANSVRETEPILEASIPNHAQYTLWGIMDQAVISEIRMALAQTSAIIADGHHRYKTALRYFREHPDVPGTDKVMVTLVNAYNPGMQVLPTHRLVAGVTSPLQDIRSQLDHSFDVTEFSTPEQVIRELPKNGQNGNVRLGFYHRGEDRSYLLTFRAPDRLDEVFGRTPREYQLLGVNILHHFILKEIFHLDTENQSHLERLKYIRGNMPATELLKQEQDYDVACFVEPPGLETLFSVAEAGLTLPQKTTYFYPKVYSGLVFRMFG